MSSAVTITGQQRHYNDDVLPIVPLLTKTQVKFESIYKPFLHENAQCHGIPNMNIKRSHTDFIFIIGIPVHGKTVLILKQSPATLFTTET